MMRKSRYKTIEQVEKAILLYESRRDEERSKGREEEAEQMEKQLRALLKHKGEILEERRKVDEIRQRKLQFCSHGICKSVRVDKRRGTRVCTDCGTVHESSMVSDDPNDRISHRQEAQDESRQRQHAMKQKGAQQRDLDDFSHKRKHYLVDPEPDPVDFKTIMDMVRSYADMVHVGRFDLLAAAMLVARFQELVNQGYDANGEKGKPRNLTRQKVREYVAGAVYGYVVFVNNMERFSEVSYRHFICSPAALAEVGQTASMEHERRYTKMVNTIVRHGKYRDCVPHLTDKKTAHKYMSAWFNRTLPSGYLSLYGESLDRFYATCANLPAVEWRMHAARAVRWAAERRNALDSRVSKAARKFRVGQISTLFCISIKREPEDMEQSSASSSSASNRSAKRARTSSP